MLPQTKSDIKKTNSVLKKSKREIKKSNSEIKKSKRELKNGSLLFDDFLTSLRAVKAPSKSRKSGVGNLEIKLL